MFFHISFDYPLAQHRTLHLTARVEGENEAHFTISDIKTDAGIQAIPSRTIKKKDGEWVHVVSQRPTSLSIIIGKAIDEKFHV